MLKTFQIAICVLISLVLWGAATAYIRFLPQSLLDPLIGPASFATTLVFAWLSVWLIRYAARLAADNLLAGVAVVGMVAMMIDGVALRWAPGLYAEDPQVIRLGAAWLLWGYGVSLGVALIMAGRKSGVTKPDSIA